jgi:hypothetical protein
MKTPKRPSELEWLNTPRDVRMKLIEARMPELLRLRDQFRE